MMEYMPLLIMGILLMAVSVPNLLGNVRTVHRHNRRRVSQEDIPAYSRMMGIGTMVIGASVAVAAGLLMLSGQEAFYWIIAAGCVAGLAGMAFAQFRYNGGLF